MSRYWIAKKDALREAINTTSVSDSAICVSGKLTAETLRKALKGERVMRSKATGIVNGLNQNDANPKVKLEDIFEPE